MRTDWGGLEMTEIWEEKVTVVVHRVPESEGFEDGFEATTMTGVPRGCR